MIFLLINQAIGSARPLTFSNAGGRK